MLLYFRKLWNRAKDLILISNISDEIILKTKGDKLYVLLLLLVFSYSIIFSFIQLVFNSFSETLIIFTIAPIIIFNYFLVYKKGFLLLSKVSMILIILILITIMVLINGTQTGILAFIIPTIVAAQLIFQRKEMKYAFFLSAISFCLLFVLLITDFKIVLNHKFTDIELNIEQFQNFIGAAFATVFEVAFLLIVNNNLQSKFIIQRNIIEEKNAALSILLESNLEKTKLEKLLEEQKLAHQRLITQINIQSQEKEKNIVATELNENINQILAVAKMQLDFSANNNTNVDSLIKKSYDNIEKALEQIRKLSHTLVTPTLKEYNLMIAINDLFNVKASESNVKLIYKNNIKTGIKIIDEINVNLYRIAQEHLNNVFQYAKASVIEIQISTDEKGIYLSIENDGIGYCIEENYFKVEYKNIESRVESYSGKLTLNVEVNKGCKLEVFLPVRQEVLI